MTPNPDAATVADANRIDDPGVATSGDSRVEEQGARTTWAQLKSAWQDYQEREVPAKEAAKKAAV